MRLDLIAVLAGVGLAAAGCATAQEPAGTTGAQAGGPAAVIRQSDAAMTCVQIADEAARLSQTMGGQEGESVFGRLGGVARAGASMLVPGAGLVIAGSDALTKPERDRREAEALAVQNRWYYLNGVYTGRRCHERAEAATR